MNIIKSCYKIKELSNFLFILKKSGTAYNVQIYCNHFEIIYTFVHVLGNTSQIYMEIHVQNGSLK